jgi:hypothetical protein
MKPLDKYGEYEPIDENPSNPLTPKEALKIIIELAKSSVKHPEKDFFTIDELNAFDLLKQLLENTDTDNCYFPPCGWDGRVFQLN